jgi:hypothetical protein
LSKDKTEFDLVKDSYQKALRNGDYDHNLEFSDIFGKEQYESRTKKKRRRKIIYFQPPFSLAVRTPVGKQFLNLVKRHFTPDHPLHKILNHRCLKISYSCMGNIKSEIATHNKRLMNSEADERNGCNCNPSSGPCPLKGKCLSTSVIYQADIRTAEGDHMIYIGTTGNTFKERYGGHKTSFKNVKKRNTTELSKFYWQLKDQGKTPEIQWSILRHASSKKSARNGCILCNTERYELANADEKKLLNKRNERKRICPHHSSEFF